MLVLVLVPNGWQRQQTSRAGKSRALSGIIEKPQGSTIDPTPAPDLEQPPTCTVRSISNKASHRNGNRKTDRQPNGQARITPQTPHVELRQDVPVAPKAEKVWLGQKGVTASKPGGTANPRRQPLKPPRCRDPAPIPQYSCPQRTHNPSRNGRGVVDLPPPPTQGLIVERVDRADAQLRPQSLKGARRSPLPLVVSQEERQGEGWGREISNGPPCS